MNVYYINLVKFFNFYDDTLTIPTSIEFLKSLIKNKDNKIILSALYECWAPEKIFFALDTLGVTTKQDNVILLIDIYTHINHADWDMVNTIIYDSLLNLIKDPKNTDTELNLDTDKFLFLMGKPHKKQRIFPLYDLYQRNCLDKCEWSLHYRSHLEDQVRPHLPRMSNNEYLRFIDSTTRDIDGITPIFRDESIDFHQFAFNSSPELFAKGSVSLVSETIFSRDLYWFVTEKVWKAAKYLHPFVLIGYKEQYEYLESLGLDTFQYAVKHPYINLVGSEEDVLKMCIDNVLHLLDNRKQHEEELRNSVVNNKNVFESLTTSYSAKLHPYIENLVLEIFVPYHKVANDVSLEVYKKLWENIGAS